MLRVKKNNKGRGVYTTGFISSGHVIEKCQLIKFNGEVTNDRLSWYPFVWDKDVNCILLGNGSIYNHSFEPNATYVRDTELDLMLIVSIQSIDAGEEITINYLGSPFIAKDHNNALGFEVHI